MVTDTAFYRYRQYHKPTDTPDKLNYPAFGQVVQGLHEAFHVLTRDPFLIGSGPQWLLSVVALYRLRCEKCGVDVVLQDGS